MEKTIINKGVDQIRLAKLHTLTSASWCYLGHILDEYAKIPKQQTIPPMVVRMKLHAEIVNTYILEVLSILEDGIEQTKLP